MDYGQKKRRERGIILTVVGVLLAFPIWAVLSSVFGGDSSGTVIAIPFAILPLAIGVYLLGRYFVMAQRSKVAEDVPVPEVHP